MFRLPLHSVSTELCVQSNTNTVASPSMPRTRVRHTMCRKPYGDYFCVLFLGDGVKRRPEYRTEKESWRKEN